MTIPTKEECLKILEKENVPSNIITHLKAVHDFSMKVCDVLEKRGIKINRNLAAAGALLHDIRKTSPNDHIIEGYELVKSLGFPEVAEVIKKHGLMHIDKDEFVPKTLEEKIIFYADKRVKGDKVVGLNERFEYIKQRYGRDNTEKELEFTKKIEKELLGDERVG
ncbi:HD domain-containing protein [Candidatus Woesearchaeota archaeon]|nr:HD domain-containing protein [Candidatus Woesearchaeota archaeon]